jgi:hypothetical protein
MRTGTVIDPLASVHRRTYVAVAMLLMELSKRCGACGQLRELSLFVKDASTKDGRHVTCTLCRNSKRRRQYAAQPETRAYFKRRHVLRTYGLTPQQYDAMLAAQDGKCAACSDALTPGKATHVDHCHATGRVRGILCNGCNTALGHAQDDPSRLRALADYLDAHTPVTSANAD